MKTHPRHQVDRPTASAPAQIRQGTELAKCLFAVFAGAAAAHAQTVPASPPPQPQTAVDLGASVGVSNMLAYVANPACINADCFGKVTDPTRKNPPRPVVAADLRVSVDDQRLPVRLFAEIWTAGDFRDMSHAQEFGLQRGMTETDAVAGAEMRPRQLGPATLSAYGAQKTYLYTTPFHGSDLLCSRPGCPPDQLVEGDVSYGGHLEAGLNFQLKTNERWQGGYALIPRLTASHVLNKGKPWELDVEENLQATHARGFFGRQGWTGVRGGLSVSRRLGKVRLKLAWERYQALQSAPLYTGNVFQVSLSSGWHWQRQRR